MTTMLSFRVDDDLAAALDRVAAADGSSRSSLLTSALRTAVYRWECERDAEIYARCPLTADELIVADAQVWPDDDMGETFGSDTIANSTADTVTSDDGARRSAEPS